MTYGAMSSHLKALARPFKVLICITSCFFADARLVAQETSSGDSSVVKSIKAATSKIYGNHDETFFFLTREKLRSEKTFGLEITAFIDDGSINRIFARGMTKDGLLSTEWYLVDSELIYIYQTVEYFEDRGRDVFWRNFKNLKSSESRYYLIGGSIKYEKHSGMREREIRQNDNTILVDARKILSFVRQSILTNKG